MSKNKKTKTGNEYADMMQAQRKLAEKKARKRDKRKKIVLRIFCVLGVLILITAIVLGIVYGVKKSKEIKSSSIAMSSAHHEIDNATMAYYYVQMEDSFLGSGDDYLSYMGVDATKSLREQTYNGKIWFDVVMERVQDNVKQMLVLLEEAESAGMTLTADETAAVDEEANALDLAHYGTDVKREQMRNAIYMSRLAAKYSQKLQDESVTDEADWNTYYAENSRDYQVWEQMSYAFTFSDTSAAASGLTSETAKEKANALAACKSKEAFAQYLTDYLTAAGKTAEEISSAVTGAVTEGSVSASGDTVADWALDAAVGDTHVVEATSSYTVYLLLSEPARNDSKTIDVRHILFATENYDSDEAAKTEADRVYALWQENPTAENFAELATEYTEDPGSKSSGGLYENVNPGEMVDTFDAWCFDTSRKTGDTGIVKTSYGYHIMYFVGSGLLNWQSSIKATMESAAYQTAYDALVEKYPVTANAEALSKVCPER